MKLLFQYRLSLNDIAYNKSDQGNSKFQLFKELTTKFSAGSHIRRATGDKGSLRAQPTRKHTQMGESRVGKSPSASAPKCLLLLPCYSVCCCPFSLVSGNGVNRCSKIPIALHVLWLSHGHIPFYWPLLPVDIMELISTYTV